MVKTMTVKTLANRIVNNEKVFILDVRNEAAFADWKIEGESVRIMNEPYFNLLDGLGPILDKLNKDEEIIVACAKGGSSQVVAEQLDEAGFANVYSLKGGMKAWSEHLEPAKIGDLSNGGTIYQFVRLGKGCLSYFIESGGEAAIVDAARMTEVYEQFAKERNVTITHVFDTHLHADHISGGRKLADEVGATYHLPEKDAPDAAFDFEPVEEGENVQIGHTTVKVHPVYSPGHTIGSTSFVVDDYYLLTGDILFVRSIGRPDLAGKAEDWVGDLETTLYERYQALSHDLMVLPAHFSFQEELQNGLVTARLGDLFQNNKGLQVENSETFRKLVTENLPPQPNAYDEIRQINKGKLNPEIEEQREMEAGPNRCAIEG